MMFQKFMRFSSAGDKKNSMIKLLHLEIFRRGGIVTHVRVTPFWYKRLKNIYDQGIKSNSLGGK